MVKTPDFVSWMNTLNREDDPTGQIAEALTTESLRSTVQHEHAMDNGICRICPPPHILENGICTTC